MGSSVLGNGLQETNFILRIFKHNHRLFQKEPMQFWRNISEFRLRLKNKHVFVFQKVIVLFIIFLKFLWLVWYRNMQSVGMSYSVYVFLCINKVFIFNFKKKKVISAQNSSNRKFLREKKKSSLKFKAKNIRLEKKKREERKSERAYCEREKAPKNLFPTATKEYNIYRRCNE